MNDLGSIWSGWKVLDPERASGGAQARAYQRLMEKRRCQHSVLELIRSTHPALVWGKEDVTVVGDTVESWVSQLSSDEGASVYEVRDKINFLAAGLELGRKQLGWDVEPPAPLHILPRESSEFTVGSFDKLHEHRAWLNRVESALPQALNNSPILNEAGDIEHNSRVSWGAILYLAMTRDGLLNAQYLEALPLFVHTLCVGRGLAWITMFDPSISDEAHESRLNCWRWLIGPTSLALLMRHINEFGYPACKDLAQAKRFTNESWSAFCKALKVEKVSLKVALYRQGSIFSYSLPAYLVGQSRGKLVSTSIPEERWRQLVKGGKGHGYFADDNQDLSSRVGFCKLDLSTLVEKEPSLEWSAEVLKLLRRSVYKTNNIQRPSYRQLSETLSSLEEKASTAAPIVHVLSLWLIDLHKKKVKQSSMYQYFNAAAGPLFQEIGGSEVSVGELDILISAYDEILDKASSVKRREYKKTVITQFHNFLVQNFDFPAVGLSHKSGGMAALNSDANLVSEREYLLVKAGILRGTDPEFEEMCHWVFVLGYRAGLRISEAVSLAIRDIQTTAEIFDGAEMILIIRQNKYVGVKSYDSRRVLPLHLLLTSEECKSFKDYIFRRKEIVDGKGEVMLFQYGHQSTYPLLNGAIHDAIHGAMRKITGCLTLRFHHLRHSFVNNLLLSYHGVEGPWPCPGHLGKLKESLGSEYTRSGLYFISQLVGHASPATTLRDYTHCSELVKRHYLDRRPIGVGEVKTNSKVAKQLAPFMDLLGIKPATIRKWRERYGEDYTRWLRRRFPDVHINNVDENQFDDYDDVAPAVSTLRTVDQLTLPELEAIVFIEEKSPEELDLIFRLERGGVAGFMSAYAKQIATRSKTHSKNFRHVRPSVYSEENRAAFLNSDSSSMRVAPPRSDAGKIIAAKIFDNIRNQIGDREKFIVARDHLRYFHGAHRVRDGYIYLDSSERGLPFVRWLNNLDRSVNLTLKVLATEQSDLSAQAQFTHWKKGVSGLGRVEIEEAGVGKRARGPFGSATLKINISDSGSYLSAGKNGNGGADNSWPVRYALVMSCVLMVALRG